jgi:hypothetical protein
MLSVAPALAAPAPADAAAALYAVYATFQPSDGIPDANGRARYEPVISSGLDALLAAGAAAEAKFASKNKDSPPLIEGDLFTSNFEGATSWKVGACEARSGVTRCMVALEYDPKDGKNKPVRWTDTLYLLSGPQGWRVDDVGYGATWPFGNKGRLSETLKEAIRDSGS